MKHTIHDIRPVSGGTHVLIFAFNGICHMFERKVFIPASEYRSQSSRKKNSPYNETPMKGPFHDEAQS